MVQVENWKSHMNVTLGMSPALFLLARQQCKLYTCMKHNYVHASTFLK